jgi:tetratricopeptide (TPR) repeat protein
MKIPSTASHSDLSNDQKEISKLIEKGLSLHQHGQLAQANKVYERILENQPTHFDALHLSGVIAFQTKNFSLALDLIGRAIEVDSTSAAAYLNRGNVLKDLKRMEEALKNYDKAILIKPDFAEALTNRGNALQELKLLNQAVADYDKAIALKPLYADAFFNRGNALKKLKRLEDALASYDKAIEINPSFVTAHSNRGVVLHDLMRLAESLDSFDKAITIDPNNAEAHINRGNLLQELKRSEEALVSFDRAIHIEPSNASAYFNFGLALQDVNRTTDALASFESAIAIKPDYAEAHSSRGVILLKLGFVDEALDCFEKAISINPNYAEAHSNKGFTLHQLNRLEEALPSYDRAVAIRPDYADAYWNKSLTLLLLGNLAQGWRFYEWRWKKKNFSSPQRQFSKPLWLGTESIKGKTILLHAEQGLGDTIQFCRYSKLVKELGARVVLEVPKALMGLLNGVEWVDELIEVGKFQGVFDYHCPLLSLPLAFNTELNSIPSPVPYLTSSHEKYQEWSKRLGTKNLLRIGLVWSGSTTHKNDHNRSLTLEQLLPYLPQDYEYLSLQKEVRDEDKLLLKSSAIKHYGDQLEDFSDTAALCDLVDLVISVDTSVAHLAGAIGKCTWVLLPYAPDWRWLLDTLDSPWYESLKLYRQDSGRQWRSVLKRVSQDLEQFRFSVSSK